MGPEDIDARAAALYGRVDWARAGGLLHVAAIHGPSNRILAIGPAAPPSALDRFVLGLARARADVLVTTGGILRSEPTLVHRYAEDAGDNAAFAAWRRDALSRAKPPRLLLLSASGRFPVDHPALLASEGWLCTTVAGAEAVGAPPAGYEVVTLPPGRASAGDAIAWVVAHVTGDGSQPTVLVEAGPSTANPLYEATPPIGVDELLLSSFGGSIVADAEGPPFVSETVVRARFGSARSETEVTEPSGPWTFARYRVENGGTAERA